jgi:hypothetical protein
MEKDHVVFLRLTAREHGDLKRRAAKRAKELGKTSIALIQIVREALGLALETNRGGARKGAGRPKKEVENG